MRIELLQDSLLRNPILRISHFLPSEVRKLFDLLTELAQARAREAQFLATENDGSLLTLKTITGGPAEIFAIFTNQYEWHGDLDEWIHIAELIEPFLEKSSGYQWLHRSVHGISVLLSPTGEW